MVSNTMSKTVGLTAVQAATRTKSRRRKGTRTNPRERRRKARERVIATALRLAEKGSFRDLTVDEIARSSGISRSAFYTHFEDKQGLLLVAVEEVSAELYEMAERWWRGVGPPAERVRRAIEGVVSVYADNAPLLRIATEVSTYDDEMRELWLGIGERFIDATAEHVRSEQTRGLIPGTLDPRPTAEALFWMAERCCYIYLGRSERKPAAVVDGLVPVWTAALYPGVIPAGQLAPR
jgi:TetR/AcrR family transcriptional regulator, ethionamide resistance regulator